MLTTIVCLSVIAFPGAPAVDSFCLQAAPAREQWTRSPNRTQAVVLIHGFHYHISNKNVPKAELRPWQKNDSPIVKELAKSSDVFVFAYGQNVPLDVVVQDSTLAASVKRIRALGYRDIVLVGHSAGGLIARHFVEDRPDAGVTKVIQVCAPNGGSPLATTLGAKSQKPFLECLTKEHREKCLALRADKKIPEAVQFVCVVARTGKTATTDGVVPCACQWTPDLHKQGIGAIFVIGTHREVVREPKLIETVASLVREKQERWTPQRIETVKKEIGGH
jgi:hypothetical protein